MVPVMGDFGDPAIDDSYLAARRLILSYGVVDQMPDVPGFAKGWGRSIVPCPYCDGFEVAGGIDAGHAGFAALVDLKDDAVGPIDRGEAQ
jgi:alkyl hydroperoxide reductase subunit AhpF